MYRDKFRAKKPVAYKQTTSKNKPQKTAAASSEASSTNETQFDGNEQEHGQQEKDVSASSNDVKNPLATVVMDESEVDAFSNIFDENIDDSNYQTDENDSYVDELSDNDLQLSPTTPVGNRIDIADNDNYHATNKVTIDIGENCTMTFEHGLDSFKPATLGPQVKINDEISGNIPFMENVSLFINCCHNIALIFFIFIIFR